MQKTRSFEALHDLPSTSRKNVGTPVATEAMPVLARLLAGPSSKVGFRNLWDTETKTPPDLVSFPYSLTEEGVVLLSERGDEKPQLICGPLIVYALTKGALDGDHGLLVRSLTLCGKVIERTFPATRLHGDPNDVARSLVDIGVYINSGKEKRLVEYLNTARRRVAQQGRWLTAITRLGWLDGDKLAFMLPDEAVGNSRAVFQPERANRIGESATSNGSLKSWQDKVARLALQDSLTTFVLAASFAGPLLRPFHSDSFGLHFYGTTSRGKTTLLQVGASVWGRGSDPNTDTRALCRKWNATGNALEAIAEEHTDLVLPLDELGSFRSSADLGREIYNLCAGQGAQRLNSNAERRAVREWRVMILSSGEIGIAEFIAQLGRQQKGGQAIRLIDIPLPDAGLFASSANAAELVNALKAACGEYFGIAGRTFLKWLIKTFGSEPSLYEVLKRRCSAYSQELSEDEAPEIRRAAVRFALIKAAGEIAIEAGVLPCTAEKVHQAVTATWQLWRGSTLLVDDGERAISAIAEFIKANPGRFPDASAGDVTTQEVYGYFSPSNNGLYLLNDVGLKRALGDMSKRVALQALSKRGLLFKNDSNRHKSKFSITCLAERTSFYALYARMLDDSSTSVPESQTKEGADCSPGQALAGAALDTAPGVSPVPEDEGSLF